MDLETNKSLVTKDNPEIYSQTITGINARTSIQALLCKDIPLANNILDTSFNLANLWSLCLKANKKTEISGLTLANLRLIIDGLEHIQQHTHEIANISIDRAEAADARASTPELSSKTKHSSFGKKTEKTTP